MTSVFGAARLVLMNTNGGDAVRRVLVAGSSDHRRTDYLAIQLPHFAPLIRLHRERGEVEGGGWWRRRRRRRRRRRGKLGGRRRVTTALIGGGPGDRGR